MGILGERRLRGDIQGKVGVAPMVDKIREVKLRWFKHVNKRCIDAPVARCKRLAMVKVSRGRGRSRSTRGDD